MSLPGIAITRDGTAISYAVQTSEKIGAPRLALVHSLALDRSVWDAVVAALAGEADILVYDCRGHGASTKSPGPYTTALFSNDLADLLQSVGWTSAFVAGASMGGSVALQFIIDYPSMVTGLGAIDTTAWYGPEAPASWRERGAKGVTDGFASLIAFQLTRWFSDRFRAEHPEVGERYAEIFLKNDPASYAATCDMLGNLDVRAGLRGISAPVEILVGAEDYATPPAMAQAMVESIPLSHLTIVPGARHLTPVEIPERVADLLRTVIQRSEDDVANRR